MRNAPFFRLWLHFFAEIFHHVRDLDLLRTDGRAGAAPYAGGGTLFLRDGAKDGRIDGLAAGKGMLIVQSDQRGYPVPGDSGRYSSDRLYRGRCESCGKPCPEEYPFPVRSEAPLWRRSGYFPPAAGVWTSRTELPSRREWTGESGRPIRAQFLPDGGRGAGSIFFVKRSQPAAPEGFHNPDRDMVRFQQFHIFFGLLEIPVQVIDLELAEFHMVAVSSRKRLSTS